MPVPNHTVYDCQYTIEDYPNIMYKFMRFPSVYLQFWSILICLYPIVECPSARVQ